MKSFLWNIIFWPLKYFSSLKWPFLQLLNREATVYAVFQSRFLQVLILDQLLCMRAASNLIVDQLPDGERTSKIYLARCSLSFTCSKWGLCRIYTLQDFECIKLLQQSGMVLKYNQIAIGCTIQKFGIFIFWRKYIYSARMH